MNAMKARAGKYPVAPHVEQGGNITKPSEYASIDDDMFADPVNYKYPIDDSHVMGAWGYISKDENQAKGGYSDSEWTWMKNRVQKRMEAAGHTIQEGERNKGVKLHLFAESFRFDGKKVSGVAIHPKKLWHPEEGQTHVFLKEELKKSASSLSGKPFGIDHLRLLPAPNIVERSWYDEQDDGVAFEGTVDDQIAERIHEGAFRGLSIELDWFKDGVMMERIGNGIAPRNFDFTCVHLMSQFPPADKDTYVKVWEGIVLPIVPAPMDVQIDQLRQAFEDRIRYLEGQISALTRSDPWTQASAPAIIIFKEAESKISGELTELKNTVEQLKSLKEAYVTEKTARDVAVAEKENKLKAKEGEFDITLKKLSEKMNAHGPQESEVIVGLRKNLVEAEGKVADAEKQMKRGVDEWKGKYMGLHKGITESIPPTHIWKCWTFGPKMMITEMMRVLGIGPNDRG